MKTSKTRELLIVIIPLFFAFLMHIAFICYGTRNLFYNELRGNAFDSLGDSLLRGEVTVSPDTIDAEAFIVNGKTYMCFGTFPALLRIIPNLLFPHLWGKWSRISCLFADFLATVAFILIILLSTHINSNLNISQRRWLFFFSFLGFSMGSPLLFLMSCGYIYHESIIWGLSWSLLAIYFLLVIILKNNWSLYVLACFSFCSGAALLSRATFGLPLFIIILFLAVVFSLRYSFSEGGNNLKHKIGNVLRTPSSIKFKIFLGLACLMAPAGVAGVFYAWYNYMRFGSPFMLTAFYYYYAPPSFFDDLTKLGGAVNFARVPISLQNYFGINLRNFTDIAPFVKMATPYNLTSKLYFDYKEWIVPLPIACPWLLIGSFCGLFYLFFRRKGFWLQKSFCFIFGMQGLVIVTYFFLTHRYTLDFFPFLIYSYAFFLCSVRLKIFPKKFRLSISILFALICICSIGVNILSSLSWMGSDNWAAPEKQSRELREFFQNMK